MKSKPIIIAIFTVLLGIFIFFTAPPLSPLYADGAFVLLVIISIYTALAFIPSFKLINVIETEKGVSFDFNKKFKVAKKVIIPLGILWGVYFLVTLIFTPILFANSYKTQMPEPVEKVFTSDVQAIDLQQVPIVDKDLARTLADKKLGEKPSLGSQVVLGEPTIQTVDGKLIWAIPLQHSGFFKWLSNMEGSAGYIKVSATSLKDVEYVDTHKIKIQPSNYFMDDLTRRARFFNGMFDGLTDYSFELDDSGTPFWVVTTYKNKLGFSLPEASGVIIVNASTGQAIKYKIGDVPSWVDRVQPEDFVLTQLNNKGEYVHGILNFSNKDKFETSRGSNIVYNNGRCYLFTGLTSVGVDESATGFVMVDMVTKVPTLYRMSGATEYSAMDSAMGKVQDLGYTATFPIIMNVFEEPTYFMTLKDSAQLIKKYAFVSIKDYMIVGVGDSMSDAKDDYLKAIVNIGDRPDFDGETKPAVESFDVQGTIERINFTVLEGNTIVSFKLTGDNAVYQCSAALNENVPLIMAGDKVNVKYQNIGKIRNAIDIKM